MKKVLYVLLPQFAEHELPYLTQPLRSDAMAMKENPKYENKIVAESMESCCGRPRRQFNGIIVVY